MKIVKFKHWYQVKDENGFTVAQFLTLNEARVHACTMSNLPCVDQRIGKIPVMQKKGCVVRRISIYP